MQELLREGAVVVAPVGTEEGEEGVESLLADCAGCPTEALLPVVADLSCEEACAALFEDVKREHGGIDHAVSVFGTLWSGGERALVARPVGSGSGGCSQGAGGNLHCE